MNETLKSLTDLTFHLSESGFFVLRSWRPVQLIQWNRKPKTNPDFEYTLRFMKKCSKITSKKLENSEN